MSEPEEEEDEEPLEEEEEDEDEDEDPEESRQNLQLGQDRLEPSEDVVRLDEPVVDVPREVMLDAEEVLPRLLRLLGLRWEIRAWGLFPETAEASDKARLRCFLRARRSGEGGLLGCWTAGPPEVEARGASSRGRRGSGSRKSSTRCDWSYSGSWCCS